MSDPSMRQIELTRLSSRRYEARNSRGGTVTVAADGSADFSPVELLLVALASCSAVDVDVMTSRRAEPDQFTVVASGRRTDDSRLEDLAVTFRLEFPAGEDGDAARARVSAAIRASHDKDCTVSRTIEAGTPVRMTAAD
ncbi:MAG TPA: OsmC family protein [Propionibacteriaceae bacterium]|nr:OsmC family protein [Propionibacteriaceae bacterium]HQE30751.1 OsmC family protein [Propionibacteriaceae bacterium]